jgi:hypothetical protein
VSGITGAAKLAATDSAFVAQVNRRVQDHLDNRPQLRAPAAHWERVSPSLRRIELDAKIPALGLNQESRVLLAFGLAAWVFAVSAFTRPVSATTWGAAVIGSHPGSP